MAQWGCRRETKGHAGTRHNNVCVSCVSCLIAWAVARLWLSGRPECMLMCSNEACTWGPSHMKMRGVVCGLWVDSGCETWNMIGRDSPSSRPNIKHE